MLTCSWRFRDLCLVVHIRPLHQDKINLFAQITDFLVYLTYPQTTAFQTYSFFLTDHDHNYVRNKTWYYIIYFEKKKKDKIIFQKHLYIAAQPKQEKGKPTTCTIPEEKLPRRQSLFLPPLNTLAHSHVS